MAIDILRNLEALRYLFFPSHQMREMSKPTQSYSSIFSVPLETYWGKHVISDWDGVWVPFMGNLSDRAYNQLKKAKSDSLSLSVLSNCNEQRAGEVERQLYGTGVKFFRAEPKKPNPLAFANVLDCLKIRPEEAAFIGDRYHPDIYGARRAGIENAIYVEPLPAKEPAWLKIVRSVENHNYQ
jgi:predicted HAD superfamily phosphohydrolase YqeG